MTKKQRIEKNIEAIWHVLSANGEYSSETLAGYTGFGGLTFVLNPIEDKSKWNKTDAACYDLTVKLHNILREYSSNEQEYKQWVQSLKASTLTAYYTPQRFVNRMMGAIILQQKEITPLSILDPAAGMGAFAKAANGALYHAKINEKHVTCFEKDILTATMLKASIGEETAKHNGTIFVYADGFETIPAEDLGKFDLVATNVPFGDIRVFDPAYTNSKSAVRREAARYIHRYYVLKGLDALRDGGLLAYIITSNYLNRDVEQLTDALQQARLIGAYRLANNLFKENGTEVGTDLLVLQKDTKKQGMTADESMLTTVYETEQGCPTNLYFQCYGERVIATSETVGTDAYGKPGIVYQHSGGVKGIAEQMGEALAEDMKQNCCVELFLAGAQSGRGTQEKAQQEQPERKTQEQAMANIFDCYRQLYDYEAKEQKENTELRKKLNTLYDEFVDKYGMLNKGANQKVAKRTNSELLALERFDEEQRIWVKADIFTKPVAFSTDDLHGADTPQEALAQSLNDYGRPDIRYMMALTGMSEDELLAELGGEVYWNPISEKFEIKAQFVAGNVIEKLEAIKRKYPKVAEQLGEDAAGRGAGTENTPSTRTVIPEEVRVLQSMRALQDAIPAPIPFEDLDFNLGERWISPQLYADFASEFFDVDPLKRPSWYNDPLRVEVKYEPTLDQFAASAYPDWNEKLRTQYHVTSEASHDLYGMDLFVHALQNTCPKMMRYQRDNLGRKQYAANGKDYLKEEDPEKTQLANTKIEEIRQGFQDWLLRQPKELRDRLADEYNRKFNCFVKPTYDGSHQKFPGLDLKGLEEKYGVKDLYATQKDCIWMLVLNGGGICDHEVGSGKTLIMCIAAHEMKRLGLCHKPMIMGLKANVSAIAETYRTAYPDAKILFATEKDYSAAERTAFFNRLKNNDWDCVIMSHDQFGRIPQSDEIQIETMQDEVEQLEASLNVVYKWKYDLSKRVMRGLERRKENLRSKILNLQEQLRKRRDAVVDFQMMGIDHILVDESHQFKNLGFTTRHDRVAGLGNSEGSKRAYNLLLAIRTIQKRTGRDLGATFLSGTTVTNSLTELYSLFRYLRPKALAKQGITCFDAWAAIFTKKSQEFEFSITNQIVLKERFRYFIKVPELAQFYNEITDFKTAEDVGIERPRKYARLLNIKPTPDQEDFIKRLMEFAKSGDFKLIGIEDATDQQKKAKMLYATDMARKMSLDMRLIDPSYADHPRSKASRCAYLVKQYYDKFDAQKGTQLIFSDLSAYDPKKWNVYEEIKRKLVEDYGIPAQEIRFIQEAKSDAKKQALIDEVNKGNVRVLFGSTTMLGTGVNAQQRVVCIHHLDTPWRPSDLEQRDGRGIRKGNIVARDYAGNQVDVIIYAVERSLDSYKFNLLHCKQTFIQQLKRGQLNIRTLDEGSMDENTGMNFAEYMAVLSGNTDLLERAKLEKKIAALTAEQKNFVREKAAQEQRISMLHDDNTRLERSIKDATLDREQFEKVAATGTDGEVVNSITLDGFTPHRLDKDGKPTSEVLSPTTDADEFNRAIGQQLFRIADTARTQGQVQRIGEVYGFPVVVKTKMIATGLRGDDCEYRNFFYVESPHLLWSWNEGALNRTSARLSGTFPLLALQRIPKTIGGWQTRLEANRASIEQLQSIVAQPWPKEVDLRRLKADLAELDRKINADLNKGEQKEQPRQAA